jgi:hypothetical protein
MKMSFLSCACAWALAASPAAAIDLAVVPSANNPDFYTGQFQAQFFESGEHIPTWQFVSPVPGTLSFELVISGGSVQFEGYQFDRGPVVFFGVNGLPAPSNPVVTGIPIVSGPHELLVGYRAAPQLPPRVATTGGIAGTLTIVSSIPEPETWILLAAGLLMTAAASVRKTRDARWRSESSSGS